MLAPQTAEARGNNTIGRLDEDGPEDSLGGSQFLSESIQLLTDQVARRPRTTSPHASRLDVSFSLTGAYSRKPGSSQHRRAGSASFGSAISTRGPVRPAVGAPDPSLSSIFLKTEPPSSVGTQPSFYRSAARVRLGARVLRVCLYLCFCKCMRV